MPKIIKWTGSLTHEIAGVVKLVKNEEVTLSDDIVRQLPKDGYTVLRIIKATEPEEKGDTGRIEGQGAPQNTAIVEVKKEETTTPEDKLPEEVSPEDKLPEDKLPEDEDPENKLPDESDTDAELTEKQEAYYKETTLQQMMKQAGESGIDIPDFLKKKSDVFQFLIDNGFNIGE
jgi:hypothetical protein